MMIDDDSNNNDDNDGDNDNDNDNDNIHSCKTALQSISVSLVKRIKRGKKNIEATVLRY